MTRVFLGLGSNLGSREALIRRALAEMPWSVLQVSQVIETEALLLPDSPEEFNRPFLNCVALVETELSPEEVLKECKAIELQLGRDFSRGRWAPREIDIDVLLYGEQLLEEAGLVVPHPEIKNRQFVLKGLVEIASSLSCPVTGEPYKKLLS